MSTASRRASSLGLRLLAVGTALGGAWLAAARVQDAPIRLGTGAHTYEWVPGWGALPEGMSYGNTHGGIVVDSQGRIYVNTDSEHAVIVYDAGGRYQKSWGKDLAGGLHGMALSKEGGKEVLFLAHTGRHEVLVASLDGEILRSLGWPESSGLYGSQGEFNPTAVAVAPDGRFYVADGYGRSYVHLYGSDGKWSKAIGGGGTEPGKMHTPHGLWIDTRAGTPTLLVADRENHRLQRFDLDGNLIAVIEPGLRRPCGMHQSGTDLVVADLAGRITLLDLEDQVIAHLGDNPDEGLRAQNGVPRERWKDGEFISPHAARFDAQGNIYVQDWVSLGRVTKLKRVR